MFGFRLYRVLLLPFLLIAALVVMVIVASDDQPSVQSVKTITPANADRARALARTYGRMLTSNRRRVTLVARVEDINTVLALAVRGLPMITAAAETDNRSVALNVSGELAPVWPGRFLNLAVRVRESAAGLDMSDARIGRFTVPPAVVRYVLEQAADYVMGADQGRALIDAVREVKVDRGAVLVRIRPITDMADILKARLAETVAIADPALVRFYYEALTKPAGASGTQSASLAGHFNRLFRLTPDHAQGDTSDAQIVAENRAIVLALTMAFVDPRVERLAGDVRTGDLYWRRPAYRPATLAGRTDLAKHFLLSAVLEMAAGARASFVAGEFKELIDTRGGSGFSFVDLAADRAGIRFARLAASNARSARYVRRAAKGGLTERLFFPRLDGLPEWLDEKQFAKRFGNADSRAYKALVRDIDERLAALTMHRNAP